ncbi:hypothetical protein BJ912DRAFT_446123 [Pholiota molesta]|nr:hypothetical protein BJ912DRAFT_446123 [Pholiota molesta]
MSSLRLGIFLIVSNCWLRSGIRTSGAYGRSRSRRSCQIWHRRRGGLLPVVPMDTVVVDVVVRSGSVVGVDALPVVPMDPVVVDVVGISGIVACEENEGV